MAREPRHRGGEGNHGKWTQPQDGRAFDGEFICRRSTGWAPLRLDHDQPGRCQRHLCRPARAVWNAPMIRSPARSAGASWSSAVGWRSIAAAMWSVAWGSAATPPAPTTMLLGACDISLAWTRCQAASAPTTTMEFSTISDRPERVPPGLDIQLVVARKRSSRIRSAPARGWGANSKVLIAVTGLRFLAQRNSRSRVGFGEWGCLPCRGQMTSSLESVVPYCGHPPVPALLWVRWNVDPILIGALVLIAIVYVCGARRMRRCSPLVAAQCLSPCRADKFLCRLGRHCPCTDLAALRSFGRIVLRPRWPAYGACPRGGAADRHGQAPCGNRRSRPPRAIASRHQPCPACSKAPLAAAGIFAAMIWFWHAPGPYEATFENSWIYWSMHLSTFGAAIWLWTGLLDKAGRPDDQDYRCRTDIDNPDGPPGCPHHLRAPTTLCRACSHHRGLGNDAPGRSTIGRRHHVGSRLPGVFGRGRECIVGRSRPGRAPLMRASSARSHAAKLGGA